MNRDAGLRHTGSTRKSSGKANIWVKNPGMVLHEHDLVPPRLASEGETPWSEEQAPLFYTVCEKLRSLEPSRETYHK